MIKKLLPQILSFTLVFLAQVTCLHASEYIWSGETGSVGPVTLGPLVDSSVVPHNKSGFVEYDIPGIEGWTFDIYIPSSYDATKPFGLISFIHSGSLGSPSGTYLKALEEKNIIWIGGRNIGNPVPFRRRTGVTLWATYRMMEKFNIDPARIYCSGDSGGSKSASFLFWYHSDLYKGAIHNIGLITQQIYAQADGFYDIFIANNRPVVGLTGYTDVGEERDLNTHHNEYKLMGIDSKVISYDHNHIRADEQQFYDGVSFVEHPRYMRVYDVFGDGDFTLNNEAGEGFYDFSQTGATVVEADNALKLTPTNTTVASVASKTPTQWYDDYGIMMDMTLKTVATAGEYNQKTSLGFWLEQGKTFSEECQPNSLQFSELSSPKNTAAILLTIEQTAGSSKLIMEVNDTASTNGEHHYLKVFEVEFSSEGEAGAYPGWVENPAELDIRVHIMNGELTLDLGRELKKESFVSYAGAVLYDDHRIIRVPWRDFIEEKQWKEGGDPADVLLNSLPTSKRCFFTLSTEALDKQGATPGTVALSLCKIRDAGADLNVFDFSTLTPFVSPENSIQYSETFFQEDFSNDGSVADAILLDLAGDTYTGSDGEDFLSTGKAIVSNLPAGFTATLIKDHANRLKLSLLGNALNSYSRDDVHNISVALHDSAFAGGNAASIANSSRADIGVIFMGETLLVINELDAGEGSLRQTLKDAKRGALIEFAPNVTTIVLTDLLSIDESLTLDGKGEVTIDANGASRIFLVEHKILTISVMLKGLRIQNGFDERRDQGGGIYNNGENLTIVDCVFDSNVKQFEYETTRNGWVAGLSAGGAIYSTGALVVDGSLFINNIAKHIVSEQESAGGAIYQEGGTLNVNNCIFSGNMAQALSSDTIDRLGKGGALVVGGNAVASISNSTFTGNRAVSIGSVSFLNGSGAGGAIYVSRSVLNMTDTALTSNLVGTVTGTGGGLYVDVSSTINLENCTLSGNTVEATGLSTGGGMSVVGGSNSLNLITVKNSTLYGNIARSTAGGDALGGAFYQMIQSGQGANSMVTLNMYNSTIANNQAISSTSTQGDGGGLYLSKGNVILESVLVAGNSSSDSSASSGNDLYKSSSMASFSVTSSLVETTDGAHGLVNGTDGNIIGVDPMMDVLRDNGGLTQTVPVVYGSPAIDAGSNTQALGEDQRGVSRVLNGQADIGAFESLVAVPEAGSLEFSSATYNVSELESSVIVTVNRTGGSVGSVSVDYATVEGVALADVEYVATSGTLTWEDGDSTPQTIEVTIINDYLVESDKEFTLELTYPVATTISGGNSATITVTSEDVYDADPPSEATASAITLYGGAPSLSWINPVEADFTGVVILKSTTAIPDSLLVRENTYSVGDVIGSSSVAYVGLGIGYIDYDALSDTQYFYKVIVHDGALNYSSGVDLTVTSSTVYDGFVVSATDGDVGSLRDIIRNATSGDVIGFDEGIGVVGEGGVMLLTLGDILIDKDLVIDGGGIVLDAENNSHHITVLGSGALDVTLKGITFQNGLNHTDGKGGAIYNESGNLTVIDCFFNNNSVVYDAGSSNGGAIYSSGPLFIQHSEFNSNSANHTATVEPSNGGAIYQVGATLTVSDSVFSGNTATGTADSTSHENGLGGAIYAQSTAVDIDRTNFMNNGVLSSGDPVVGRAYGGALYMYNSVGSMTDCNLSSNNAIGASVAGGAIYFLSSDSITNLTLERCSLVGNNATGSSSVQGGAMSIRGDAEETATVIIINCTLSANSVKNTAESFSYGGALYLSVGNNKSLITNIESTTIANNSAISNKTVRGRNGGLRQAGGVLNMKNVLIGDNTMSCGYRSEGADFMYGGGTFTALNCLVEDAGNRGFINHGENGNVVGFDPLLEALAYNGGLTQTIALTVGSPAIDAGVNLPETAINDQRAEGFERISNGLIDIGAFETQMTGGLFSVTYNGNGSDSGSVPVVEHEVAGTEVTLADNAGLLVKNGFVFIGWNSTADGSGIEYAVGSTYMISANVILYAQWGVSTFEVTLINVDGSQTVTTVGYGEVAIPPAGVDTAEYIFRRWPEILPATENVTYTALYRESGPYSVTFNAGSDGDFEGDTPEDRYKEVIVENVALGENILVLVPEDTLIPPAEMRFDGWDSTTVTLDNQVITATYAYIIPRYAMHYYGNGSDGGTPPRVGQLKKEGVDVWVYNNKAEDGFFKNRFEFESWNTSPDGSGTRYGDSSVYSIDAEVSFYAQWTPLPPEPFANWAQRAGLVGVQSASTADPDGDGVINLMEYLVDSDPLSYGAIKIGSEVDDSEKLSISYESPSAVVSSYLTVVIEGSNDLGVTDPWIPVDATYSVSGTGPYIHAWTQDAAIGSGAKSFIRISVPNYTTH